MRLLVEDRRASGALVESISSRRMDYRDQRCRAYLLVVALAIVFALLSPAYAEVQSVSFLRSFGTPANDAAWSLAADASAIYVVGATQGTFPGQTKAGDSLDWDAFIRKDNASGEAVWTRQFGTSKGDVGVAVTVQATGIYVAGTTSGEFPGQTKRDGLEEAFLRKYDPGGHELWTRQFGAPCGQDGCQTVARDVAADRTGIYVMGWTSGVFPNQTDPDPGAGFIRKYDADGNELWTRQFSVLGFADDFTQITTDDTGIYVVGTGLYSIRAADNGFVRKYDTGGNELWTLNITDPETWSEVAGVAAGSSGIYVAGLRQNLFVSSYDGNGKELWTRQFTIPGSHYWQRAWAVASDATGVYVAATAEDVPDQNGTAGRDVFVRKYDASGTEVWTSQFFLPRGWYNVTVRITSSDTAIYVAGGGVSPDRVSGLPANEDAFLARFERITGTPVASVLSRDPAFSSPRSITTDGSALFVVNRPVLPGSGSLVSMSVHGGPVTPLYAGLRSPSAVTALGTDLFWIDPNSGPFTDTQVFLAPKDRSRPFHPIYTGSTGGQPIVDGTGVTTDGTGLFTADSFQGRVHRMNPDGSGITLLGSRWQGGAGAERPQQIAEGSALLYIADAGRPGVALPAILGLPKTGGTFTVLHAGPPLVCPSAIAVRDRDVPGPNQVFVADPCANTLWGMPKTGGRPTALLSGPSFPGIEGLAFYGDVLYAAGTGNSGGKDGRGAIYKIVPRLCDQNWDGNVDRDDISQIFASRNTARSGPNDPRDVNGDGFITVEDARKCSLFCTKPNCVP